MKIRHRKDAKGTTDSSMTLLGSRDMEKPVNADANWPLWKLAKDLKLDEIQALITKREGEIKYLKKQKPIDYKKIKQLYVDIGILSGAYTINKRKIDDEKLENKEPIDVQFIRKSGDIQIIHQDGTLEYVHVAIDEDKGYLVTYSIRDRGRVEKTLDYGLGDSPDAIPDFRTLFGDEEEIIYVKGSLAQQYEEIEEHIHEIAKHMWGLDFDLWGELTEGQKEILNTIEERFVKEMLEAKKKAEEEELKKQKHKEAQQRYRKKGD